MRLLNRIGRSCFLSIFVFLALERNTQAAGRVILTEVMAENRQSLADEDGDFPDWVEIQNVGDESLSLDGLFLSDDRNEPNKWAFPALTLPPGQVLVVFCSGKDRSAVPSGRLDAGFDPKAIPGLTFWVDATDVSTVLLEGESVVFWLDKSGNENHASQGDPGFRPRLGRFQPEQLPVIEFDGDNDLLGFVEETNIRTMFWVGFEAPDATNSSRPILGHDRFFDFHRGKDRTLFAAKHTGAIHRGTTMVNARVVDPGKTALPSTLSQITVQSPTGLRANLLASDRLVVDRIWQGGIGEVLLFDRPLLAHEIAQIHDYLNAKWRLPASFLHTSFRLQAGTETVSLFDSQANLIDSVALPEAKPDVSVGRSRSEGQSSLEWRVFSQPSPGTLNGEESYRGVVPRPEASLPAGSYGAGVRLSLQVGMADAVVRYTIDGSLPNEDSPAALEPLRLDHTVTLRFAAFKAGYLPSRVVTHTYLLDQSSSIAQIALTTEPGNLISAERGIYIHGPNASPQLPHFGANFWRDWERPVSIELFGEDGSLAFQQDAGFKVHGGWSRAAPQKSLALIARNRYGNNRFEHRVFEEKPISDYKQWLLRNSGNDWVRTLFRDALSLRLAASLGLDHQAYQPVHVYLNSEYWGIHNLRERLNEHFVANNHDLSTSDFDLIEGDRLIIKGDLDAFDRLLQFLKEQDPTAESFASEVAGRIDLRNFFDYLITQIFIDNTDWPSNNVRYWRERGESGLWRWIPYDLDGGFDIRHTGADTNTLQRVLSNRNQSFRAPWVRYIFQRLLKNPSLSQQFVQRFEDLINTTYSAVNTLDVIESMERRLDPEIERHIARWGGSSSLDFTSFESVDRWKEYVGIAKAFAVQRPDIVRGHLRTAFGLGQSLEVVLRLPEPVQGRIRINGMELRADSSRVWQGRYSIGRALVIEAIPQPGYRFVEWGDGMDVGATRLEELQADLRTAAIFEADDSSSSDPAHALSERPFSLQAFYPDQTNLAVRLRARDHPDRLALESEARSWSGPLDGRSASGFEALGYEGVAFFNSQRPAEGNGFADSVVLSLDTRGVHSGHMSWTVEVLETGEIGFGVRPQYRIGHSGPFVDFGHVPASDLVFLSPEEGRKPKRFSTIPLPVEMIGHEHVTLRWGYFRLDNESSESSRPKIRLDDIVILANEQEISQLDSEVVINEIHYHPASGDPRDEFIELYNQGEREVDLSGWRLTGGVDFEFRSYLLGPKEYVVIAANLTQFQSQHSLVSNVLGPWSGRLSNQSETIRLINARGDQADRVTYADEGAWSLRVRGIDDHGHQGWTWSDAHDGGGHSLELIAPGLSNNQGANWKASAALGGTPGALNSVFAEDGAPLLSEVSHFPVIPRASDAVTVRVRARDENLSSLSLRVYYRSQSGEGFREALLWDDGMHGDGGRGDGLFAGQLPPFPDRTIVSFFVQGIDAAGNESIWPRFAADSFDVAPLGLFQVDDQVLPSDEPLLRVVMSEAEQEELRVIGELPWNRSSDAQMNATFISQQGAETELRYQVGFRLRGSTSRAEPVKNRRVNFRSDETWKGRNALILNAFNVPSQILGSRLFRMAGVPAAAARPVRMLENGINYANAGAPQFGRYAELEALGDAFVRRQFPLDSDGNLYRPSGNGNLEYLGDDPIAYQQPGFYSKATNRERDDWSDLIELTRRLEQSSDASYVEALSELADVDRWVSYFAVDTLLANTETSFANGGAGDYALYTNADDQRAYLIAYDLDSLWVMPQSGAAAPLFRATANPVVDRFLKHPELARRYHRRLRDLVFGLFSSGQIAEHIDAALGGWVSAEEVSRLKEVAATRRDFVLNESRQALDIDVERPFAEPEWLRYYLENTDRLTLKGGADPVDVESVWVNGQQATFEIWSGRWEIADVPLHFGVNPIVVRADAIGGEGESRFFNVFRPGEGTRIAVSELTQDEVWSADESPIVLEQSLRIPPGVSLSIEAGTSVEFNDGAELIVEGQLTARGAPDERIFLSRNRRETTRWGGLQFMGAQATNELHHVTIEWSESPTIRIKDSNVSMEGLRWSGAFDSYIHTENSSLRLKDSVLPNAIGGELITGFGVPENGFWILEGNEFGTTSSGGDIVDFSGGRRPDTMLEIIDNVFVGGPDDGLDLDGAAALIDGNEFRNFQKANSGTGDAHAVSTGLYEGRPSDLSLFRNVFSDNEHALLMKEGAVALAENNTFVRSTLGTVNFSEVERGTFPPDSLAIRRSIIWDSPVFRHLEIAQGLNPELMPLLENSLVFPSVEGLAPSNLLIDPLFEHPIVDFRLQAESPAIGAGANGFDLGAFVGRHLWVSGEPPSLTPSRSAFLFVAGVGVQAYRYRVNGGDWSEANGMDQPIILSDLSVGPYSVEVIGQSLTGRWQTEKEAGRSRTWFVNPQLPGIRINEILARNDTAHSVDGEFPDFIELYNADDKPFDLSRMQLSDDPVEPNKFIFPAGTVVAPGGFVLVYADRQLEAPGFHADFRVSGRGGGVYLRQRFSQGEALVDSIEFGRQLSDRSLSRGASGEWGLGEATPLMPNRMLRLGESQSLKINEWLASPLGEDADFVELFNSSSFPVHLGGLALSAEPSLGWKTSLFPSRSYIAEGEFIAFFADNGEPAGPERLGFTLANEQGLIGLLNQDGEAIDQVAYAYQRPGVSLERTPPGGGLIRANENPSPGRSLAPSGESPEIVLNEIVADNRSEPGLDAVFPDWVELHNPSLEPVSLNGYSLSDNLEEPERWVFPSTTVLDAEGFLVIEFDAAHEAGDTNTGFGLKADGDAVYLFRREASQHILVDEVEFGIAAPGWSLGRELQSGDWTIGPMSPGAANQSSSLGSIEALRVNEWMARPDGGSDWFELFNPQSLPVDISGLILTDDLALVGQNPLPSLSFMGTGIFAYLVFEADGEPDRGALHVDFRLSADGESIGLYSSEGRLIDAVNFGEQARGVSEGAIPDGGSEFVAFVGRATRGRENFLDGDGDQIQDSWEVLFGLNPENPEDGLADSDQDGMNNRREFLSGTDPLDAASRFVIEEFTVTENQAFLVFQGQAGQSYSIEATDDLESNVWVEVRRIKRLAKQTALRLSLDPILGAGFYRVTTR